MKYYVRCGIPQSAIKSGIPCGADTGFIEFNSAKAAQNAAHKFIFIMNHANGMIPNDARPSMLLTKTKPVETYWAKDKSFWVEVSTSGAFPKGYPLND